MRSLGTLGAVALLSGALGAHEISTGGSDHGLRFFGTGSGQQDRVRIALDDDLPGPGGSAPCDVGAGSFTLEFWMRGQLLDNPTTHAGGGLSSFDDSWRDGNLLLDRDVLAGTERHFGVSVAGGLVRFGTGAGDTGPDLEHTLEGSVPVLDGAWHHIACMRDASDGTVTLLIDGQVDLQSATGISTADLSYPDAGVAGADPWGPFLVLGAEKHDSGPLHPAFNGSLDELRIWNVARTPAEIALSYWRTLDPGSPGLVGLWRFEEGSGTVLADSSAAGSPDGELVAGLPGNGQWTNAVEGPLEAAAIVHVPLPPGFVRSIVTAALGPATCMSATPDGRLFLGEHTGAIRVVDAAGTLLGPPLITLSLAQSQQAQGLLGMTLDPGFATNGFLYVYYTSQGAEPANRVSRFTVVGNTASPASEFVVWQNASPAGEDHLGGSLRVGNDGFLYIATGDNFVSDTSRDLTLEHGKLLRVALDGQVPVDNPFLAIPGAVPTLWARGLRNPFRMALDDADGSLFISDVGGNKKTAEEEVNRSLVAADFGWPNQEGRRCFVSDCEHFAAAEFAYAHNESPYFAPGQPGAGTQGAAILGPVYDGTLFPPEYIGDLFLADYANLWIRRLERDAQGQIVAASPFLEAPEAGPVVDLDIGADGALYYLTFADPASTVGFGSVLYRVSYVAGLDQPPVALASADVFGGVAPLAVQFDSLGSFDPDGGVLTWSWDFGDGNSSTLDAPLHTYTQAGHYVASLTVSDGANSTLSAALIIDVGNPPVVTITNPLPGTTYSAGDIFSLTGSAVDPEDGTLGAGALVWSVRLIHAAHTHPSTIGPGDTFRIPNKGHTPENTHFEFTLTATDSDGLPTSSTVAVFPIEVPVLFDSYPQGVPIFVDGQAEETPRAYTSLPRFRHKVEAQEFFTLGARTLRFSHWTDWKKQTHSFKVPPGGGALSAVYVTMRDRSTTAAVDQASRCAMHRASTGQQFGDALDPLEVTFGREATGVAQAGLEFTLDVPPGALIRSAKLVVTASADQLGAPVATLWSYDVDNAPAFVAAEPTPLTAWAPLSSSYIRWAPPPFTAGLEYESPDLSPLIQRVVDRSSWSKGNTLGIVLDGTPARGPGWRSFGNFASGTPPRLEVGYSLVPPGPVDIGPKQVK